MDNLGHFLVGYRPAGVDRFETPADVCGTCSDFGQGQLVPVSFCVTAAQHTEEYYGYLTGGPKPLWMWEQETDAARWTPAAGR